MSTLTHQTAAAIRADLPAPFHDGGNKMTGVTVNGTSLTIDTAEYFFRYDCQSGTDANKAGGCVTPFGFDSEEFRRELNPLRDEWVEQVRACGK